MNESIFGWIIFGALMGIVPCVIADVIAKVKYPKPVGDSATEKAADTIEALQAAIKRSKESYAALEQKAVICKEELLKAQEKQDALQAEVEKADITAAQILPGAIFTNGTHIVRVTANAGTNAGFSLTNEPSNGLVYLGWLKDEQEVAEFLNRGGNNVRGAPFRPAPQAPALTDTAIDQSYKDHFGTYMPDREPLLWVRKLLGAAPQPAQPLTDSQIIDIAKCECKMHFSNDDIQEDNEIEGIIAFARAIEAALRNGVQHEDA
jgi:BioD-like phosphotransacetylase family protein